MYQLGDPLDLRHLSLPSINPASAATTRLVRGSHEL
jgi:hypothetical protein